MNADERESLIERLKKDNCCTHERGHLFNCHKQCQWCHQMQTDIDAADAATELARLAAENKRLSDDKEFLMPELERLAAENAELRAENKALRHEVEEWKQAWKER